MTFKNKGWIRVQKFEDISDDKNTICCVKPLEKFLGKSEFCILTAMSGAFDGSTILLEINEKNDKHRYLYIGGDMVCSFLTNDKMNKYISNMGNNLMPYSIAKDEENIDFLTPVFEFVKR